MNINDILRDLQQSYAKKKKSMISTGYKSQVLIK